MIVDLRSVSRWLAAATAVSVCLVSNTEAFGPVSRGLSSAPMGTGTGTRASRFLVVPNLLRHPSTLAKNNNGGGNNNNNNNGAPLTVMYRIRCENKYYQLEELEDSDNCTTELFLKEDGSVDVMETDGPIFTKAVGTWYIQENRFAMTITKTFSTGIDNKKDATAMGEFSFDVERVFEGDMTVVGGTEVAINGKIFAEDIITSKMDKEVGFFNMIDGTELRLERRSDARPKNIGVVPSPIDSNDVRGHDGIPREWLEPQQEQEFQQQQQPQIDPALSAFGGGNFGQDAQGYGGGGQQQQQQQQQQEAAPASNWGSGAGYEQEQQSAGISEYGNPATFGQESQGYGGSGGAGAGDGYGQQQHGSNDPGPSFADYSNYYDGGQEQQEPQAQEGEYYSDGSQPATDDGGGGGTSWDDYYNSQGGYNNNGGGPGVTPMGGGGGPNPWP